MFFLMWFVTGLVLVYFPFPNVSDSQKYEKMDALPASLPDLEQILARLPETDRTVKKIQVRSFQDQTLFTIKTKDSLYTYCADISQDIKPLTKQTFEKIAKKWVNAPVAKIDTIHKRDQWIMYTRYLREMPIYKYYFDDKEKHQLYISSKTGEVQQFSDKKERFWAWMGAIPHKFYFTSLRVNQDAWLISLKTGGVIALIAAITGMYIGLFIFYRSRKLKLGVSPYKKHWYKWHHITGLVFGVFLITWAFSGAMALQRIPQWVLKTDGDYSVPSSKFRGKQLPIESYQLDYRMLIAKHPDLKSIEWGHFQDIPVYNIVTGNQEMTIDASSSEVKELFLPEVEIDKAIRQIHGKDAVFTTSLINEYEEYYLSRKRTYPLPAYKVLVDNADKSRYYIDPKTGDFRYLNRSRLAKKWIFSGLHYLNIKWLVERPFLWTISIWVLCLGGAYVSLSGVYLSVKYLKRKIK